MTTNRIILPIKPQTWVRIQGGLRGDQVLFRIPEVCIKGRGGGPCSIFKRSLKTKRVGGIVKEVGYCKHTLYEDSRRKKRRIEKYNKYRLDLYNLAKAAGFELPTCGWSVYFYFPVGKQWKKSKKIEMHGQLRLQTPDTSNLLKAFEDSLSITDEQIAQISGMGKFWFLHDLLPEELKSIVSPDGGGYVEILINQPVYNPFEVTLIDQNKKISMSDLLEQRQKRLEQRKAAREKRKKKKPKQKKKPSEHYLFRKKDGIK